MRIVYLYNNILHKYYKKTTILMIFCNLILNIYDKINKFASKINPMKKIVFTLIFLCIFINIQAENINKISNANEIENQYDKLVEFAKTYIDKNTEYAFNCAYKASLIAEDKNDKKKIAECSTIMGDIFAEIESYPIASSYYSKAIEDLIDIKDYTLIYKMYIKLAFLHQKQRIDNKLSINAMNEALTYAIKTNMQESVIETNLAFGDIYLSQNDYESAIEYYNEILKNNISKNTIGAIATAMAKKAEICIKHKDYENAMQLIDSSLYLCIRDFNDSLQITNYCRKAEIYDSIGDIESAKKYYTHAAKLAYETEDYDNCGKIMLNIGNLNKKIGNYDKAIKVFKVICDSTEKFKRYKICYQSYYQLSQCYATIGLYEDAYRLFNKYDIYWDSSYAKYQEKKMDDLRSTYLLSLSISDLKSKKIQEENKHNNKKEWILITCIIIVTSMIMITYIILHTRNKSILHKNEVTTYEQQLKIDKMENELMEYQLKSNREMMVNLALHLKSFIELINPLKDEMKKIMEAPDEEQKSKIKDMFSNLQNKTRIFSSSDNLYKRINTVYKDFLDRLDSKHPGLTKSEKKLCVMLFINMSCKDIAAITNTTTRSVETSRYRLRKKFNLSREDDIISFLHNI